MRPTTDAAAAHPVLLAFALLVAAGAAPPSAVGDEPDGAAGGLRKLSGTHLVLYTDVPSSPDVDQLPAAFDAAVPQWGKYFGVEPKRLAAWRVTGSLMRSAERFRAAGLLPDEIPKFRNGYSQGTRLWLYDQTNDSAPTTPYYRRHLLLHEGVHSLMNTQLGALGPPWYAEGTAEMLATHSGSGGAVTTGFLPRRSQDVPGWGRIEMVRQAVAAGRSKSLRDVLGFDTRAHRENEPYGWCWTIAALLDGHPRYRDRFRKLKASVGELDFDARFEALFARDLGPLAEEWEVLVGQLEYGYDFARMAIDFVDGRPLKSEPHNVSVKADRGWQSSGVAVQAGRSYRLRATGRFQVAQSSGPWISEAGGVTIRYYQGRPLGQLLAAVRPSDAARRVGALARPSEVGLSAVLQPEHTGTLYLRINDSPAELAENAGELTVTVTAE